MAGNDARLVLVVDDDASIASLVETTLKLEGYRVLVATDGDLALELAAKSPPEVAVVDLNLPGLYGTSVVGVLRAANPSLRVVLMSALPAEVIAEDAWLVRADAYLVKPFELEALLGAVRGD